MEIKDGISFLDITNIITNEYERAIEYWNDEVRHYPEYKYLYEYYLKLNLIEIKYINLLRSRCISCNDALSYLGEIQNLIDSFDKDGLSISFDEEWKDAIKLADEFILNEIRNISKEQFSTNVFTVYTAVNLPEW